jgi:Ca-activated chloride channel homolog
VNRSSAIFTAALLCGVATAAQTPRSPEAVPPTSAFRSGIDLVALNVTVTDAARQFVGDLEPAEFSIFEDGVRQDVVFFRRQPRPISLSLLLDSSASMSHHLPVLQGAAKDFIKRLGPNDLAQVVDFDGQVQILQAFTSEHPKLESAILATEAGGSTALYNAIYVALSELSKQRAPDTLSRRQALVVFSDGEDTSSLVQFEQVLELARRAETGIYTIALRTTGSASDIRAVREAEYVLRTLAQETGGRGFFPTRIEELPAIYAQIADEIGHQYTIGYTSTNLKRDGAWRRLFVRLSRPNATARTRAGYFAPNR